MKTSNSLSLLLVYTELAFPTVGHRRGSMDSVVGNCVVDGVGNNWGMGNSMVGTNVSVVSSDDLAVTTMGHSSSASLGEGGAGGSGCPALVGRLVIGDSRGRLGQGITG